MFSLPPGGLHGHPCYALARRLIISHYKGFYTLIGCDFAIFEPQELTFLRLCFYVRPHAGEVFPGKNSTDKTIKTNIRGRHGGIYMKENRNLKKQLFLHSKGWLTAAIFAMIILSIYNIVVSWLLQKIIDIASGIDKTPLSVVIVTAVISFLIFMIAYVVYRTARPRYIQESMRQYKTYVFGKILNKRISEISKENSGKLISALTNDMRPIEDYYLDSVLSVIDLSVGFVGALTLMVWYSPVLTVISLLLSVLPVIVSIPGAKQLADKEKTVSDKNADYVEIIKDILSGFPVIKGFQAEKEIQKRFVHDSDRIEEAKQERRYAEENVNLLSTAASVIMRLGVFIVGAWMAVSGTGVTPGIVLVFLQLVSFVILPIEKLPAILANRKAAAAIMDKFSAILDTDEREQVPKVPCAMKQCISIEKVSFGYEDGTDVLRNINIKFEAGKKYAVVGGSGSGKTTLLNLLMQTYDHYCGSIKYDGTDLKSVSADSLFRVVSLVQQNVFVFNDTIYNNVTLYKRFSDNEVNLALERSGLTELIHSHGKDYVCGENGRALSGGERQRISIARALLRQSSVLLMDEATAALDEITANGIMNVILSTADVTSIVVTHRLDEKILKRFDEIVVLHNGTIEEIGSFENLLDKKGYFFSLFRISQ